MTIFVTFIYLLRYLNTPVDDNICDIYTGLDKQKFAA